MPGEETDTYDRVSEHLRSLWDAYGGFTVTQTTVPVDAGDYDRAIRRAADSVVEVSVSLDEEGDGSERTPATHRDVPRAAVGTDERIEAAARRAVREATGAQCRLDGPTRVEIVGLVERGRDGRAPLYRLTVHFRGRRTEDPPSERGWRVGRVPAGGS